MKPYTGHQIKILKEVKRILKRRETMGHKYCADDPGDLIADRCRNCVQQDSIFYRLGETATKLNCSWVIDLYDYCYYKKTVKAAIKLLDAAIDS